MWASSQRQPDMVRLLLQSGANPNAVSALRNWARTTTAEATAAVASASGFHGAAACRT